MGRIDGEGAAGSRAPLKCGLLPRSRQRRHYRARMLRTALTVLAALGALALSAPAAGAVSLEDLAAQEEQRYAAGLVRVAMEMVGERHRACKVSHLDAPATFTDDAPSTRLLSLLALLRRPPIAEDALPADSPLVRYVTGKGVYRNWYRMGRAADGVELYLVSAREARTTMPTSRFCLRKRHAQLLRLLRDEDRRTGALALRAERQTDREQRALRDAEGEQVFLYGRSNSTLTLGGWRVGVGELERRGLLAAAASHLADGRPLPDRSHVVGVFPDGVTSIELTYPRRADRGRFEPDQVYESELRMTAPVQDNLASFHVDRDFADAEQPSSVTWRAADGSVVRVVRPRR